jgi:hypothetical protein
MNKQTKEILDGLQPLFDKAEKEGLWFYCSYQQLWFSPNELKNEQSNGRFLWGAVNWQLRDPHEKLKLLQHQRNDIDEQIKKFSSIIQPN